MKSLKLAAIAFAVAVSGAASAHAAEISPTAAATTSHSQAWDLTKLRTHAIKHHHRRARVYVRPSYRARIRAHIRKRYRASWIQAHDRFEGFPWRGDGFRGSGKNN